jgi:hypothetical protein
LSHTYFADLIIKTHGGLKVAKVFFFFSVFAICQACYSNDEPVRLKVKEAPTNLKIKKEQTQSGVEVLIQPDPQKLIETGKAFGTVHLDEGKIQE